MDYNLPNKFYDKILIQSWTINLSRGILKEFQLIKNMPDPHKLIT